MKILVTIANYGTKNRDFLEEVLSQYRTMRFDVTIVVNTEEPRDLGPDVENIVGHPTEDPRSLPFAHRRVMTERADEFDLFVYSEDDTLITEAHIDAFLRADAVLPEDHVPGFLRFEEHPDGRRSYCSIHSHYYWDPATIQRHGDLLFCAFTNFHAASYILTRDHLRQVLATGRFAPFPHEGRYSMLESAASGPFLSGALHRLICVSLIDEFMLHHMPNQYLGKLGIDRDELDAQLSAIRSLADAPPHDRLFETTTRLDNDRWDRHAYGSLPDEVAAMLGPTVRSVLTVGAGSGRLEHHLMQRGKDVTAVPLDAVFAAMLRARGLAVTAPAWPVPDAELDGRRYEAVLLLDVLNHVPDPVAFLEQARGLLTPDGTVVARVPNLRQAELRTRLGRERVPVRDRPDFENDRLHHTDRATLLRWIEAAGLHPRQVRAELPEKLRGRPVPRPIADRVAASFVVAADVTDEPRFA
jgi:2-polyprenyl-3-methyl-5-hydroxy-6-metoxy-1,4-benzoquinol methylase